jgi:hypothetical protein
MCLMFPKLALPVIGQLAATIVREDQQSPRSSSVMAAHGAGQNRREFALLTMTRSACGWRPVCAPLR